MARKRHVITDSRAFSLIAGIIIIIVDFSLGYTGFLNFASYAGAQFIFLAIGIALIINGVSGKKGMYKFLGVNLWDRMSNINDFNYRLKQRKRKM